ncbi:MAG TPA: glycoside hydrolase family 38 C-terminal domain-containing protein [Gemmatimonadaceae bacterium]|nr:glycoside hydrolase family 38 C-terminal domain-containing protein [Gemmatimonadaceae bacterium]
MLIHVVSHTHWDREWYHRAERFRQRLVALVDEVLDKPPADRSSFLLDGQAVVLEDYLAVRPERASELAAALREGRLEAGPWYVLADELIPSGEALVRNLLAGRRVVRSLRAEPPPVLHCPDSFGHPAVLPALAHGFGCDVIVVWRGFGGARWPATSVFWWRAPDGDRTLTWHLTRSGYELGANLELDADGIARRWRAIREQLTARGAPEVALLLNGADHHGRQHGREQAVRLLTNAAAPDTVRSSSLRHFGEDLAAASSVARAPDITGELRDSYGYTWTLQGTLASRTPQKRRYVRCERELLRDVEPWAALARFAGSASRRHLVCAAWQSLLLCQPHDTLCGCSIDEVAHAMDERLAAAAAQSAGIRLDALLSWLGHDVEAARAQRDAWVPTLVVRNRAARPRAGVAIVELTTKIADVPVGPGSEHVRLDRAVLPRSPRLDGVAPVQVLSRRIDYDRLESPRNYPDNDAVQRLQAAVWVDEVPAYGVASVPFSMSRKRPSQAVPSHAVRAESGVLTNGTITLRFARTGAVSLEQDERRVDRIVEWESRRDRGDLYTPAIREPKLDARLLNTRVVHRGPLRGSVEQRWRLRDRDNRIDVRLRFTLDAGARWVRIHVAGLNDARDHRLRLRLHTDVAMPRVVADAAFAVVERRPLDLPDAEQEMEHVVATAPLHRYVSLFNQRTGATIFSDGLTEYEADGSSIAVTVIRSVGELSRSDIAERPGHAGWPAATPLAQCPGPFEAELALMLHAAQSAAVTDEIEHAADDVLYPLTGETVRYALHTPAPRPGAALSGVGLAPSTIKESEDGNWLVLRCVNLTNRESAGSWRLPRDIAEAHLARLDELPLTPLAARGDSVSFLAAPHAIVTILVR